MSKNTLNTIIKLGGLAAVLYGAYKLGEYQANKNKILEPEIQPNSAFNDLSKNNEQDYIVKLINELKSKPNKTQKDKNNIELLEVKLKQIKNK